MQRDQSSPVQLPPAAVAARPAAVIRSTVTFCLAAFAMLVADRIGIINLIAKGYGSVAWLVIGLYVLPLLFNRVRRSPGFRP